MYQSVTPSAPHSPTTLMDSLVSAWRDASITFRISLLAGLIMLAGMVVVGEWVARSVEAGVVHDHAADAALYTDSIVAAHLQELRTSDELSAAAREKVDGLLAAPSGRPIVAFRIWKGDTIVHAESRSLVGTTALPTEARRLALQGEVHAQFGVEEVGRQLPGPASGQRLLEVYAPVRRAGSNDIIAIVETYELAPALERELRRARLGSWAIIAAIGALMQLLQIAAVHKASRLIMHQRQTLSQRVEDLSRMLAENTSLRMANEAGTRMTENNERFLRKIGADLHDGPLQLLGMAMLRLDGVRGSLSNPSRETLGEAMEDFEFVAESLAETAKEIRDIAAGLSLPEIGRHSLDKVIGIAVKRHERHSGMPVAVSLDEPLPEVSSALKVCIYRLVQEGLSNVMRHAHGKGQTVDVRWAGGMLHVAVLDRGPGFASSGRQVEGTAQGLSGLRDRVEALGGMLVITDRPEGGASIRATFQEPWLGAGRTVT